MYIDGFLIPVRNEDRDTYRDHELHWWPRFKELGALSIVAGWGDDVPEGKQTDFRRAVAAKDDETVVFSWLEWPDRATRDAGMDKFMKDPRMADAKDMPFDGKRMIFGGFGVVVELMSG